MGIIGNLSTAEIIEQLFHALSFAKIRNVVFMGMGEPLDNYDNVKSAVLMMINDKLFGIGSRHVTVSTVGVIKNMYKLTEDMPFVSLALSLHAPNQTVRLQIVPTAGTNKYEALMEAMDNHIASYCKDLNKPNSRVSATTNTGVPSTDNEVVLDDNFSLDNINKKHNVHAGAMIEYILIHDINDRPEHARELGSVLLPRRDGIYLNLIPYNPTDVAEHFEPPKDEDVKEFVRILTTEFQIFTRVRHQMGDDVSGACGQLVVENLRSKQISDKKKKKSQKTELVGDIEDTGNRLMGIIDQEETESLYGNNVLRSVIKSKEIPICSTESTSKLLLDTPSHQSMEDVPVISKEEEVEVGSPGNINSKGLEWWNHYIPAVTIVGVILVGSYTMYRIINKSK